LAQAEAWASANKLERIGLHVVGTNSIARQLYALCGYELLNCYLQKMITPQTAASVPNNQSVRFFKPQDESDYQQVFQLDFEHFHEVALSTCAIPAVQVREAYQKFMNAVNIRNEWIVLAQDDEQNSVGFIWAYQSRGDLGDQEYAWLRNLQVVNQQPDLPAALLKQLESWAYLSNLSVIRTGVTAYDRQLLDLLLSRNFVETNLYLQKTLLSKADQSTENLNIQPGTGKRS
jgi:hypothetical protein